jgi:hypothetical protein
VSLVCRERVIDRLTLALLVALAALLDPSLAAAVTSPSQDSFYAPPPAFAAAAPGTVLRSREVSLVGLTELASGTAYQLLYRTEDATGAPIAAVTTLMLPSSPAPGPRKLLSYQTAEDSLTTSCAPSYALQSGSGSTQLAESGEMALGLAQGWDVVVPDHEGPQSEWGVGPLEGRTTLDSIRAVEQFAPAQLEGTTTPVAMMGYSGGAIPTTWGNALAPTYAPELHLVGVAAGGIAADPIENLDAVDGSVFAGTILGLSIGVDRAYPFGLDSLLSASGRGLAAQDAADGFGCAGSVIDAPFGHVSDFSTYPSAQALAAVPVVQSAFAHVDLIDGPVPQAPSYFYNAINDELAIIKPVDALFAAECARGAAIDYHRDPVGEHNTGAGAYVAPALQYLEDRFAGKPAPNTCPLGSARPAPAGGSQAASAPRRARAAYVSGRERLVVRHVVVRVPLSCPPAQARCTGTLALRTRAGELLGRARFDLAGAHTGVIAVRLTRRLTRGAVIALVKTGGGDGQALTTRRMLTLAAPSRTLRAATAV